LCPLKLFEFLLFSCSMFRADFCAVWAKTQWTLICKVSKWLLFSRIFSSIKNGFLRLFWPKTRIGFDLQKTTFLQQTNLFLRGCWISTFQVQLRTDFCNLFWPRNGFDWQQTNLFSAARAAVATHWRNTTRRNSGIFGATQFGHHLSILLTIWINCSWYYPATLSIMNLKNLFVNKNKCGMQWIRWLGSNRSFSSSK
jgi:hypothetical protein